MFDKVIRKVIRCSCFCPTQ